MENVRLKRNRSSVAMMQPTFLPWLGYFELIDIADKFIFLDDCQFSVQSFHQRNKLFVNKDQTDWYTVPVNRKNSYLRPLLTVEINDRIPWQNKMWKRIAFNYKKSRYFNEYALLFKEKIFGSYRSLSAMNIELIVTICDVLNIGSDFDFSSEHSVESKRSQMVLDLLEKSNANVYYSPKGAFSYMKTENVFPVDHIDILFQDFVAREYRQVGSNGSFVSQLSVLDSLFNAGPGKTLRMIKTGTAKWLSFDEMCQTEIDP